MKMHLSPDQLHEVSWALQYGLHKTRWDSIPAHEQKRLIAEFEVRRQALLSDLRIPEEERRDFRDPSFGLIGPDIDQREARERIAYYGETEQKRSRRASGAKMAINDLLSQSRHFSESQRAAIDARLAAKELPTLRMLEAGFRGVHARILKRGRVRNDEEYYIVAEILSDMDFDISDAERSALEGMHGEYAAKKK